MKLNIDGIQIEIVDGTIHINTKTDSRNIRVPQYESDSTIPKIKWGAVSDGISSMEIGQTKRIIAHNSNTIHTAATRIGIKVSVRNIENFNFNVTRLS